VILVDTSVWIDHFRSGLAVLSESLERGDVFVHPFVIGELACGNLQDRKRVLALLAALPFADEATHTEVLFFIEQQRLMGRGIGYVDAHLLAAVTLTEHAQLWTRDKHLHAFATKLRVAFKE
jgi:predicted nucleic acid-binding protein